MAVTTRMVIVSVGLQERRMSADLILAQLATLSSAHRTFGLFVGRSWSICDHSASPDGPERNTTHVH